jgi:NADPH:quinone reductase-like Zn-dependent oxidoreductase
VASSWGQLADARSKSGAVRPVVDKVFPFASTNEALAFVETGRARGKVVVQVQ